MPKKDTNTVECRGNHMPLSNRLMHTSPFPLTQSENSLCRHVSCFMEKQNGLTTVSGSSLQQWEPNSYALSANGVSAALH